MSSEVEICNRALQIVGARRIVSLTEDSVNARACNLCYNILRDAELRAHPWSFSIKRAQLASETTSPPFGKKNSFPFPGDFLCLRAPDYNRNSPYEDFQIEGRKILSDLESPLQIRYTYQVTDPNEMDVLYREALSARIAMEICEELTQSNTKISTAQALYKDKIREARRVNAIEKVSDQPPEDTWVTVRR